MAVRKILLLGDETLYKLSKEISKDELDIAKQVVNDLRDTILDFRKKYGYGRAIAAPQIDELYRIIYMNLDGEEMALINPKIEFPTNQQFEVWDDCMSFPGVEVRLKRYKSSRLYYKDLDWEDREILFEDDLSELIQHEYDHLEGILSFQRAINAKAFRINMDKLGNF